MTEHEHLTRSAIHKTLAACTHAGDSRKADVYAACFTEDGVLDLVNERIEGREAIRRWMNAPSVIKQPGGARPPSFISHHLTTCRIELASEGEATVRTYWLVTSGAGIDHNGYYDDRFVARSQEWLIAWRRPRTLWISPDSLIHGKAVAEP
jgi:SnoaL-like domain